MEDEDQEDYELIQACLAAEERLSKEECLNGHKSNKNPEVKTEAGLEFEVAAHEKLKKYYGHVKFRPYQLDVIRRAVLQKQDQLLVMATGYGKSVCYQLPAILSPGLCIVISPLISLMQDQVQNLKMKGVKAAFLGSAQTKKAEVLESVESIFSSECKLLYLTPEYIDNEDGLLQLAQWHSTMSLSLIAIDEAHCISQWGHDFRKSFRQLGQLRLKFKDVPFMAVTGTATPKVRQDIITNLHLVNCKTTCTSFDRPNLKLMICTKGSNMVADLRTLLHKDGTFGGPTIVYCPTRKTTEDIANKIANHLRVNCNVYHAGMTPKDRKESHESFSKDHVQVMVATVAFGMGIDKPDIRQVIHYGAPKDIECYYQEIGRAGRDGLPSKCTVFYSTSDFAFNRVLLGDIREPTFHRHKMDMLQKLELMFASTTCRRKNLLSHFEGSCVSGQANATCCDNCIRSLESHSNPNSPPNTVEVGNEALMLLSTIQHIFHGHFGATAYISFLRKKNDKRFFENQKQNSLYGAGLHRHEKWWKALLAILRMQGYIEDQSCASNKFLVTLRVTDFGRNWLSHNDTNPSLLVEQTKEMMDWDKKPPPSPVVHVQQSSSTSNKLLGVGQLRTWKTLVEWNMCYAGINDHVPVASDQLFIQEDLFKSLTNIRQEIANDLDVAPYMIASNRALIDMTKKRPGSIKSLELVEDLPEQNIRRSGDQFITAIKEYCLSKDLSLDYMPPKQRNGACMNIPNEISLLMDQLPDTVLDTYKTAIQDPMTLCQVADVRGLSEGTAIDHIAKAVLIGLPIQLDLYGLSKGHISQVHKCITCAPLFSNIKYLKPIKESLPPPLSDLSYGQLRIIINILEYEFGSFVGDNPVPVAKPAVPLQPSATQPGQRKLPQWMSNKSSTSAPPPKRSKSSLFSK